VHLLGPTPSPAAFSPLVDRTVRIQDPDSAYRYLEVRGRVVEITEEGADDHIDSLARKYMGLDRYPNRTPNEVRVIYKILAEKTSSMG
jgi:hypothetical protein